MLSLCVAWQVSIGSIAVMADPTAKAKGGKPRDWFLRVTEIFLDQDVSPACADAASLQAVGHALIPAASCQPTQSPRPHVHAVFLSKRTG